jgi:hypothetical protein
MAKTVKTETFFYRRLNAEGSPFIRPCKPYSTFFFSALRHSIQFDISGHVPGLGINRPPTESEQNENPPVRKLGGHREGPYDA